jgi:hypothetical protein
VHYRSASIPNLIPQTEIFLESRMSGEVIYQIRQHTSLLPTLQIFKAFDLCHYRLNYSTNHYRTK